MADSSATNVNRFMEELKPLHANSIKILANEHGQCVEIMTEDVPYYAEWIKGEGADIALYRAIDNHRLIGALLPLRNWDGTIITGTLH